MKRGLVRLAKVNWLQRSLLTAIAVALVGTQSIGLFHRIEHGTAAGWVGTVENGHLGHAELADRALDEGGAAEHHCAAIDALALADAPPAASMHLPVSPPAPTHTFGSQPPNAEVAHLWTFQARAPPVLLS